MRAKFTLVSLSLPAGYRYQLEQGKMMNGEEDIGHQRQDRFGNLALNGLGRNSERQRKETPDASRRREKRTPSRQGTVSDVYCIWEEENSSCFLHPANHTTLNTKQVL